MINVLNQTLVYISQLWNKHLKMGWAPLVIRKMQIINTEKYHLTLAQMAEINPTDSSRLSGWGGFHCTAVRVWICRVTLENSMDYLLGWGCACYLVHQFFSFLFIISPYNGFWSCFHPPPHLLSDPLYLPTHSTSCSSLPSLKNKNKNQNNNKK